MAERVDLPGGVRHAALAERVAQKAQSQRVRVDERRVVRRRLVRHRPAAQRELQTACTCTHSIAMVQPENLINKTRIYNLIQTVIVIRITD